MNASHPQNGQPHGGRASGSQTDKPSGAFASLAHDALELGELQLRLAKLDAVENARKLRSTAILAVVGTLTLMAALPVALFSLGEWLAVQYDWTRASALFAAAGCGLIASGLLFGFAYYKLRQGFATWQRSTEELQQNIQWLKQTLKPSDQSASSIAKSKNNPEPNYPLC